MKNIILLVCVVALYSCKNQSQAINKEIKKQDMEYFNIDKYKDWEIDSEYSSDETSKSLKKGNDRLSISFSKDDIFLQISSTLNNYVLCKLYFPNKSLEYIGRKFSLFKIGKWQFYDECGKLVKEVDEDAPYKFSVGELVEKIKKEYDFDIEKKINPTVVDRKLPSELNNKPFYEVLLSPKTASTKWNYVLVDGTTGETLFTTFFYWNDERTISPFGKYLESLKKQEAEDNTYFTTYKGKDYTKKEWEIFEEEWHKNHEENKNKGFWDDIFPTRNKK